MKQASRPRPATFRAMGREGPPRQVTIGETACELQEIFKHDSWAATALYRGQTGSFVAKFNRAEPILGIPMRWLGCWLARREARACRLLAGLTGVPVAVGPVVWQTRRFPTAFAHDYVPGHPLAMDERPSAAFFDELETLLAEIHARGMAYADLNKRENILVTEAGTPFLVDYQICFAPPSWMVSFPPVRWLLRELQTADRYHLRKHRLWHRPETVPASERDPARLRPMSVRLWRIAYVAPMQAFRRRLFTWMKIRTGRGLAVSELEPEKAARESLARKAADSGACLPGEE